MASDLVLGFLGAGKMATALASGFHRADLTSHEQMLASDVAEGARRQFSAETGARTVQSNLDVVRFARVLVLAVKPDKVASVIEEVRPEFTKEHLLISIAAGVPLSAIEELLGPGRRVARVMPNTPALVTASATAFALGKSATQEDAGLVEALFKAVGIVMQVPEKLLDAVTGLSGSGPAYAFMMIEALSDGGVAAGLPRDVAMRLAAQTVLGAARMVIETGQHPGALKDMVASPGGTTIEGICELEKLGMRHALISAVRAASEKSKRLGGG